MRGVSACQPRPWPDSDAVAQAVGSLPLGAMGAAEDAAVLLDTVAGNPHSAMGHTGASACIAHSKLSKVWVSPIMVTWNALS